MNETLQIRSALESYCTLQIARESDTSRAQALFAELNELLYKMETVASTSHSIETFCQYDFQFHTSIINSLNNKQFTSLFAALMYRMRIVNKTDEASEADWENTVTITASSIEELLKKISDYQQNERMNTVQTKEERLVGGHIDYKG